MNIHSYRFRALAAFSVTALLFAAAIGVATLGIHSTRGGFAELQNRANVRMHALSDMFGNGLFGGIAVRNKVFKPQLKSAAEVVAASGTDFAARMQSVRELTDRDDRASLELLDAIAQRWRTVQESRVAVLALSEEGRQEEAIKRLTEVEHPNWQQIRKDLQSLMAAQEQAVAKLGEEVNRQAAEAERNAVLIGLAALILGALVLGAVMRSLHRRLALVNQAMEAIASGDGDLTRRLDAGGSDELSLLAGSFNRFADKIAHLVREVMNSTTQLAAAAEEMSAITGESRRGIERQNRETEQVATAVDEMVSTVHQVARSTAHAAELAKEADGRAAQGGATVQSAGSAIRQLVEQVGAVSAAISALEQETRGIGGVLQVITEVAEQTNLLALNAAIEAARAGESGRGFAVVADEVRTLAGRTQSSTAEIRAVIERLQRTAREAVAAMERGRAQAGATVAHADQTAGSLREISERVASLSDMNTQIATAAEEQSAVAEEISRNVNNIKLIADEAAVNAAQMAEAGGNLARLAADLEGLVHQFKVA